jgi:squalene synthase HpnC
MASLFPNGSANSQTSPDVRVPIDAAALAAGWAKLPASYAIPAVAPSLTEAEAYCRRLATSHYENFGVVSWFLPKELHQHFFNIYSYCRISDDLGDEVGDPRLSLVLLDKWGQELSLMYARLEGRSEAPTHPVFVALATTVAKFGIPKHEFSDLLIAFRQDQKVGRYETFGDLLGYCKYSANPVGHLVLYLCGYGDVERQLLSDYTCTALQLANFWQDVAVDWEKNRVYLPLEDLRRFNVCEEDIAEGRATAEFRQMMKFEVERARDWFDRGLPLIKQVKPSLALDIELFSRGGQEILNAIEKQNYDILSSRPTISKLRKTGLLLRALAGKLRTGIAQ